jgi:hypothetical protein
MQQKTIRFGLIIIIFICIINSNGTAQNNSWSVAISNNVTALPVTGYPQVFYSQCHPGMEFSRNWKINKKEKNRFFISANTGFYYHRFIQTTIWIYPSVNYEYAVGKRFSMQASLGFGYAFSIEGSDVSELNSNGVYEQKSVLAGRSQYIAQLALGGSYALSKEKPDGIKLILQLKNYLQGTYINSYVPLLPINSILIGVAMPIKSKTK